MRNTTRTVLLALALLGFAAPLAAPTASAYCVGCPYLPILTVIVVVVTYVVESTSCTETIGQGFVTLACSTVGRSESVTVPLP